MASVFMKECPICGSKRIRRVRRNIKRIHDDQPYLIRSVTFYSCPDCGESFYDQAAVDKIQSHSPEFNAPVLKSRRAG